MAVQTRNSSTSEDPSRRLSADFQRGADCSEITTLNTHNGSHHADFLVDTKKLVLLQKHITKRERHPDSACNFV